MYIYLWPFSHCYSLSKHYFTVAKLLYCIMFNTLIPQTLTYESKSAEIKFVHSDEKRRAKLLMKFKTVDGIYISAPSLFNKTNMYLRSILSCEPHRQMTSCCHQHFATNFSWVTLCFLSIVVPSVETAELLTSYPVSELKCAAGLIKNLLLHHFSFALICLFNVEIAPLMRLLSTRPRSNFSETW